MMKGAKKQLVHMLALLVVLSSILSVAASATSSVTRAVTRCPSCGSTNINTSTYEMHTNEVIGTCEDDSRVLHYRAYKYRQWICGKCKEVIQETVIATGHYCACGSYGWD